MGIHARRTIAYIVLILVSFFCLFWFYVMIINATRSNGQFAVRIYSYSKYSSVEKLDESCHRNTSDMERHDQQPYNIDMQCKDFVYIFQQ